MKSNFFLCLTLVTTISTAFSLSASAGIVDSEIDCAHEINPKCRTDKLLHHSSEASDLAPEGEAPANADAAPSEHETAN